MYLFSFSGVVREVDVSVRSLYPRLVGGELRLLLRSVVWSRRKCTVALSSTRGRRASTSRVPLIQRCLGGSRRADHSGWSVTEDYSVEVLIVAL